LYKISQKSEESAAELGSRRCFPIWRPYDILD